MYQESTISLHKEDQVVEEKQSYAMVTGLLQILVHRIPESKYCPLTSLFGFKVASIAYQRYAICATCFHSL